MGWGSKLTNNSFHRMRHRAAWALFRRKNPPCHCMPKLTVLHVHLRAHNLCPATALFKIRRGNAGNGALLTMPSIMRPPGPASLHQEIIRITKISHGQASHCACHQSIYQCSLSIKAGCCLAYPQKVGCGTVWSTTAIDGAGSAIPDFIAVILLLKKSFHHGLSVSRMKSA
jgi:hypothetical protein